MFGTTNITLNKGYIGYRYFVNQASADPGEELIGITDGGGYYQEKLHDETWSGDGTSRLKDSGNIFGGGYIDNSSVDRTNVMMYGGHVRNSLFGGGEIAAVGRGVINVSGEKNSIRTLQGIYKAGHTSVKLYDGYVHRNVAVVVAITTSVREENFTLMVMSSDRPRLIFTVVRSARMPNLPTVTVTSSVVVISVMSIVHMKILKVLYALVRSRVHVMTMVTKATIINMKTEHGKRLVLRRFSPKTARCSLNRMPVS